MAARQVGIGTFYRWDLDRVVPANEGPGTTSRFTAFSYLQDLVTTNGKTTVRDAVIKQITYGSGTTGANLSGTVDFLYNGVSNQSSNPIQPDASYNLVTNNDA